MTFRELDYVRLLTDVDGIPAGSMGTVVIAHTDPVGYTVEFPDDTTVDVDPDQLEIIEPANPSG